jgi:hypothetical protein
MSNSVTYHNLWKRVIDEGGPRERTEYSDGSVWFDEKNVCRHCLEQREVESRPYRWADEQYSFGVYAGRYCEECWPKSGFRDATDPDAEFDPMDAGEVLEASDY